MVYPLLRTKLFIPPSRPELVLRPRLVAQLDEGLQLGRKLSLISAPAGYGKTTLIVDWAYELIQNGNNLAWLSLDAGDNEPVRFWTYVISALNNMPALKQAGFGQLTLAALQSSQPPQFEYFLTDLINEIVEFPENIVVVLDDLHLVTNHNIHAGLSYLLEHIHPATHQLHIVAASRQDPPWPMARLRASDDITELRAKDLRFTEQESQVFINNVMGLELSVKDSGALGALTEGWIAGLQMAALSMQGRSDISIFLESFSGSNRFVLDYLVEEVLDRQTPAVQDFLLKSAVLERMTASLCTALCYAQIDETVHLASGANQIIIEQEDLATSQEHLTYLEEANLFLVPLDDRREWFRYHQLFADLLERRLCSEQPHQIADLHRRASTWYEAHGWAADAVNHALAADDLEHAAGLIEINAFTMLDLDRMGTLQNWLERIPADARQTRPWLGIAHAWVQVYAGQLDETIKILQQTENTLIVLDEGQQRKAIGHINTIRSYAAWLQADGESAVSFASFALEKLPEEDLMVRALAAITLAQGLVQCGDLAGAVKFGNDAVNWGRNSGSMHVYKLACSGYAYNLIMQGRLHEAEGICRNALEATDTENMQPWEQSPAVAQVYAIMSEVMVARNKTEQSVALAREGLNIGKGWAQVDTLTVNYMYLISALIAAGELEEASEAVNGAKEVGAQVSEWFDAIIAHQEAELLLAAGNISAAVNWAEQRSLDFRDEFPQSKQSTYQTFTKVLIAQGKLQQASHLLNRMISDVEESGAMGVLVKLLPLKAVVHAGLREQSQAAAVLDRALLLAEPERIMRPFLSAGEVIIPILRSAINRGSAPKFAAQLLLALDEFPGNSAAQLPLDRSNHPASYRQNKIPLAEPLTRRETEVLHFLNTSLSIPEIAREMYVAPSTVRSHVRSIYGKLGVHGRFEAVQLAKELELI